jgi:TonB-linked SusC/RagA family outer membrane protein
LEVTGVANRQEWRWGMSSGGGILYTLDPNRYNVSNASNLHNEGGYRRNWEGTRILIGYAGRASYKFDDRYYVDVTVRRDGSSRFAPGRKWGTFPAVGLGWRVTNEKFMQSANTTWLNDLKLRANWGKLGNELATFGWKYLAIVNPGITMPNYPTGSGNGDPLGSRNTGAYLPDFANTELSWEITTSGVGFDAVLFNNKLNLTVEYYNRLTSGIIQQVAAPFSSGIQNPIDLNIGEVVNKGIEISTNYNTKIGLVSVGFTGNFTTVKNEVTKLYNGVNVGGGDEGNIWEGYPINFIRGYKVGGIFQSQAEIDAWRASHRDATAGQSTTVSVAAYQPGDMWFQDVARGQTTPGKFNMSPDSIVNDNDRVYLGKTIPGFYYGFGANASFRNIDLSVFFRGQGDVQRINDVKRNGESMSSTGINQLATVLNRWTPSNPSNSIPRAVYGDPRAHTRFSDRWVEDAGFMRLQNIELAYRLPPSLLSKTNFIQGIRVYVMGTNLVTFTNYSGVDPESDYNPVAKQWVFGLNASF